MVPNKKLKLKLQCLIFNQYFLFLEEWKTETELCLNIIKPK